MFALVKLPLKNWKGTVEDLPLISSRNAADAIILSPKGLRQVTKLGGGGRGKNVIRRVDKEEDRNNDGECKF